MERETRRDRRARFEVETLEGRKLMSAGSGPGIKLHHVAHEHMPVQPSMFALVAAAPHASGTITISGKTSPRAKVILALLDGRIFEKTVWSNASGRFRHTFAVGYYPHQAPKTVPVPGKSALIAAVRRGPDANGSVTISGKTYPKANVTLDLKADGAIEQTVKADAQGGFQFTFQVGFGSTPVRLSATSLGGKATSTILTVTRPFVDYTPGTSGSPQTKSGGGSQLPANSRLVSALSDFGNAKWAVDHAIQLGGDYYYTFI